MESFGPMISLVPTSLWGSDLTLQGNLVLEDTIERHYLDLEYADEALGVYLIRGENVVMLGELV